jgi:hypothetical protein
MRNALVATLARVIRPLAAALVLGCGVLALAAPAQAGGHGGWHGGGCCWGGGARFSFFFGWPGYYAYPAYYPAYVYPSYVYPSYVYPSYAYPYYPPVTVVQQVPPPGPAPIQYWYYCDNPKGYYPYVQSCGRAWQPVPATPPGAPTQ